MMYGIPNTWRMVKLDNLVLPVERKDPKLKYVDTFNYIDISSIDNKLKRVVGDLSLPVIEAPSRARQVVQTGDVIVSTVRPALNAVAIVPETLPNAIASTGFCVLRPQSNLLLSDYLFHFVTTEFFSLRLVSMQKGGAYPAVTDNDVRSVAIPLPPLSEQQQIVRIFHEAEEIRKLRDEAEAKTHELIPAIFADIFGDLFSGKSPFPVQMLSTIGELDRGKSKHRPRDEPSLYGGPYPFLQTGDIAQANGWVTRFTQTYSEKGLEQSRLWPKGTLAITIAANIGSTAILTFDACFPDSVVGFVPKSGISVEYVRWWLFEYQKKLELQAPQGAQKNINLKVLRSIQIPVPPLDLQMKFKNAVQNLREQMELNNLSEIFSSALSSSLFVNAFSGQITAEWRENNWKMLALEAQDRDAALKEAGASLSVSSRAMIQEMEEIGELPTDGVYSDLNNEQRFLLFEIRRMVGGVRYARYFTAETVSKYLSTGLLMRNPQAVEGHLAVFAARGLIIPVSREEQTEDTGAYVFGHAYRLPMEDNEDFLTTEDGNVLLTEAGEELVANRMPGDHSRLREMERLATHIKKERTLR